MPQQHMDHHRRIRPSSGVRRISRAQETAVLASQVHVLRPTDMVGSTIGEHGMDGSIIHTALFTLGVSGDGSPSVRVMHCVEVLEALGRTLSFPLPATCFVI